MEGRLGSCDRRRGDWELHLLGHWPVFVIVLNICAAGLASSGPNSFASFVGKSVLGKVWSLVTDIQM